VLCRYTKDVIHSIHYLMTNSEMAPHISSLLSILTRPSDGQLGFDSQQEQRFYTGPSSFPGYDADRSSPFSAQVKVLLSYTSTPPYDFMAWYVIKRWGNVTSCTRYVPLKRKCKCSALAEPYSKLLYNSFEAVHQKVHSFFLVIMFPLYIFEICSSI
jgi:hypothetical protein